MCFKVTIEHSSVDSKHFLIPMLCFHYCGPLVVVEKSKEQPSGCFTKFNTAKFVVPNSTVYFTVEIDSNWKLYR